MFEYKNTKTGATFSSPCVVSGGDWVVVGKESKKVGTPEVVNVEPVVSVATAAAVEPETDPEEDKDLEAFNGINLKQIKQELDAFGVDYDKRAPKRELYDLMMTQGK